MNPQIRVGIIGFGLSGRVFHAPFLKTLSDFQVTRVLSSSPEKVREYFSEAIVVTELKDLLQSDVDLVINCAPNEFHFSYTAQCLEAGKHVVVEKPFVNTVTEGEKLVEIARRKGKILTVFQNRRYDGDFLTVKKLLEAGTLGDVKLFESHFDRMRPEIKPGWREGTGPCTGILFDLGSHLIDQAFHLFGKTSDFQIDIETQRKGAVAPDYFHIILKYGKLRVILHSSCMGSLSPRFRMEGTKGNFIKYGMDPQENALKAGRLPGDENFGVDAEEDYGTLVYWDSDKKIEKKVETETGKYIHFYQELAECILGKRKLPPVPPEEALEVIRLIEKVSRPA